MLKNRFIDPLRVQLEIFSLNAGRAVFENNVPQADAFGLDSGSYFLILQRFEDGRPKSAFQRMLLKGNETFRDIRVFGDQGPAPVVRVRGTLGSITSVCVSQ